MRKPADGMATPAGQLSLFDQPRPGPLRIYTIHPSLPFLDTLSKALLEGKLPWADGAPRGPLELAQVT